MNKNLFELLKPVDNLAPLPGGLESSGSLHAGIRAAVFDIYGTLLISGSGDVGTAIEAGTAEAFGIGLQKAGIDYISPEGALAVKTAFFSFIGDSHRLLRSEGIPWPEVDIIEIWKSVISDYEIMRLIPDIINMEPQIAAAAYESTANPVSTMPGAAELLLDLRKRGVRLGIISNAQFYTPLVLETALGADFKNLGFEESLCLFSYIEKRSKPDSFLFSKLESRLGDFGITPSETVFIGNDMLNDIMPASKSGYQTALFAGDRRSLRLRKNHDACRNIKPDVIVNKLMELSELIKEG